MMYPRPMGPGGNPGSGPGVGRPGPYPNPAVYMTSKRAAQGQYNQSGQMGPQVRTRDMVPGQGFASTLPVSYPQQMAAMGSLRAGGGYPVQQPLPSPFPGGPGGMRGGGIRPGMCGTGPHFSQGQYYGPTQQYSSFNNQFGDMMPMGPMNGMPMNGMNGSNNMGGMPPSMGVNMGAMGPSMNSSSMPGNSNSSMSGNMNSIGSMNSNMNTMNPQMNNR